MKQTSNEKNLIATNKKKNKQSNEMMYSNAYDAYDALLTHHILKKTHF